MLPKNAMHLKSLKGNKAPGGKKQAI